MDVTNATHNFPDQEWQRLRGHYDFINQRREHANWRGRGGPTILLEAGSAARGWGRNSDVISVLQQASSIQSEITANMNPRTDMQGADDGNGGNSFGVASYGGQKIHFENQGRWGLRTMSKTLHRLIEAYVQHGPILQPIPHALLQIVRYTASWTPVVLVQNFVPIYLTGKVCDVLLLWIPYPDNTMLGSALVLLHLRKRQECSDINHQQGFMDGS